MKGKIIIFIFVILKELNIYVGQLCDIYDINLQKIKNEYSICNEINKNITNINNSNLDEKENKRFYCDTKISHCVCDVNYFGENCQKKIKGVNVISKGISNGDFILMVLLFIILSSLIYIIGFLIIVFIFRNEEIIKSSRKIKIKNSIKENNKENKIEENKDQFKQIKTDTNNFTNINTISNINDNKQNSNSNINNLFKRDNSNQDISKINNEIDDYNDNNKYSQIPLSTITDRKDENMLITLRNNTNTENENDIDISRSKVGILNKNFLNEDEEDIYYGEKLLEIEEYTGEFKSSLEEVFSENESFMIFTDKIFTNLENDFSKKYIERKVLFNKSKFELQKIFIKLNNEVPRGKNYIKSNKFNLNYERIFNINPLSDPNLIQKTENIIYEDEENINYKNSEGEISFSKDNTDINPKKNTSDLRKIVLDVKDKDENKNKNLDKPENVFHSEREEQINESNIDINKIKNRVLKKAFMIKSVEVSRTNTKKEKEKDNEKIEKVKTNQKKRVGSNVSNLSYK